MEMQEKIMQVGQLQQMMQNPEAQQNPELKQEMDRLVMEIESRKAVLISEMTEEFVKEQNKIMGDLGNDPIAKLRARELDIKAQDNLRKQKEDDARLNLDKMKAMMNQSYQQEKMDQTEDLAELRAETSLTKQKMSNQAKAKADATKRFDVSIKDIETIDIQSLTFNELMEKNSISIIDKLQIDVEGAEFEILNSIDYKKTIINKIIFEAKHFDGTFKEGPKLKSIKEKLISFNYKLKEIDKENILAEKN